MGVMKNQTHAIENSKKNPKTPCEDKPKGYRSVVGYWNHKDIR